MYRTGIALAVKRMPMRGARRRAPPQTRPKDGSTEAGEAALQGGQQESMQQIRVRQRKGLPPEDLAMMTPTKSFSWAREYFGSTVFIPATISFIAVCAGISVAFIFDPWGLGERGDEWKYRGGSDGTNNDDDDEDEDDKKRYY